MKILYSLLNRDNDIACERCFAPWMDMETKLREHELPLVSLESAKPLSAFDVVGFSLQYELTFTNVLMMLDLGGIPLRTLERTANDPLVIAGGPTATHPEPMAPFFDAIVIGDGEEILSQVAKLWVELRDRGHSRHSALIELAKLGGVYVPSLYDVDEDEHTGVLVVSKPQQAEIPFPSNEPSLTTSTSILSRMMPRYHTRKRSSIDWRWK